MVLLQALPLKNAKIGLARIVSILLEEEKKTLSSGVLVFKRTFLQENCYNFKLHTESSEAK